MKNETNDNPSSESVTADEVAGLKDFLDELDCLEAHTFRSRVNFRRERVHRAQVEYLKFPCDENFEMLRTALLDESSSAPITAELLNACNGAFRSVANKFQPFVRPIIERLLTSARTALGNITVAENERHKEIFGSPLHGQEFTTALMASRGNVNGLEHLLAIASRPQIDQSTMRQIVTGLCALRAG
jgi:hypothetical protein